MYILSVRFSDHFERDRQGRSDRHEITLEMCERIKSGPVEGELQENGRTAYWGYVEERNRYLKVVVESDGEEITTAHWDRGFERKMRRRDEEQGR